ncbi:hypothetical protein GA565_04175 [Rouxiella sp. S1S-2]|uniref:hypothetical protein n=1 Tax=Rouxiella sp. S1S-2 TaxID=2653856 RepID=UPI001264906A|nr:hypothetical protein [Rouxiella sp. S1S-2]KAB7895245.1 hypothetical protein GA565_04175 [Rouxiella sp. S1S-2]
MHNERKIEFEACPFCNSPLSKSPTNCFHCGAEMMKGYINTRQRKQMLAIRILLISACLVIFFFLFQSVRDGGVIIVSGLLCLLASWIGPLLFFKIKNKKNNIWKKKPIPW